MGALLAGRRRQIQRKGKTATLGRPGGPQVTLKAFKMPMPIPRSQGDEHSSDAQAEILADEINAAGWPAPPRYGDLLTLDGYAWVILDGEAVSEGETVIGYSLRLKGGT